MRIELFIVGFLALTISVSAGYCQVGATGLNLRGNDLSTLVFRVPAWARVENLQQDRAATFNCASGWRQVRYNGLTGWVCRGGLSSCDSVTTTTRPATSRPTSRPVTTTRPVTSRPTTRPVVTSRAPTSRPVTPAPTTRAGPSLCGPRASVPVTGARWCYCAEYVYEQEAGVFRSDFGPIIARDWYHSASSPLANYARLGSFMEITHNGADFSRLSVTVGTVAVMRDHYLGGSHVSFVTAVNATHMTFTGANQKDPVFSRGSCYNVNTFSERLSALTYDQNDGLYFLARPSQCTVARLEGGAASQGVVSNALDAEALAELDAQRAVQSEPPASGGANWSQPSTKSNVVPIVVVCVVAAVAVLAAVAIVAVVLILRRPKAAHTYAAM